eukprot:gene12675-14648_t
MNKRPFGESYGGGADELSAGNNDGPRKFRGVFPAGKKFRAVMQLDGVRHNLGMYVTEIEAAQAYDRFARESPEHAAPAPIADYQNARVIDRFNNRARAPMSMPRRHKFPSYSWSGSDPANGVDGGHPPSYGSEWADDRNGYPETQSGYGRGFPSAAAGYPGEGFQSQEQYGWSQGQHPPMQPPHLQFQQPRYNDWRQPYWQQESHHMYHQPQIHQQGHNPYVSSMAQNPSSMEYIAVPHAIAEEVRKYVRDFLLLEQQDLHQRQPPTAPQVPPDQENHLDQQDQVSPKVEQQGLFHAGSAGQGPLPSLALHREPPCVLLTPFPSLASTMAAPEPTIARNEKVLSHAADSEQVTAANSDNSVAEQALAADSPSSGEQAPASAVETTRDGW